MTQASTVDWINGLSEVEARTMFLDCCGCETWAASMVAGRPYDDNEALAVACERRFDRLADAEWLEAFAAHPKIGDLSTLRARYASSDNQNDGKAAWAASEQSQVAAASEETLRRLASANERYDAKHGFIFIICASGKSAEEMLKSIDERMENDASVELANASREQRKITALRIEKLSERRSKTT
jgi:OHCU decarboxylase